MCHKQLTTTLMKGDIAQTKLATIAIDETRAKVKETIK